MLVAGCKGAAADCMSQSLLQGADSSSYDHGRTLVFGVWSGGYCGGVLYLLYNRLFPRIFPLTTAVGMAHPRRIPHMFGMVAFDNFVSSPWFFVPSYYIMREWLRETASGSAFEDPVHVVDVALRTYRNEFWDCMTLTWSLWIPIHFMTFGGIVPQHLRVHFTAVCSFFTLAAMSALQGRLEKRRASKELTATPMNAV